MEQVSTREVPSVGQLAHARGRRFVTLDVINPEGRPDSKHLVRLASVDDSLGDEITVVWEAEPNAETLDFDALPNPEGLDDPETLDAFLNAVRWGIVNDIDRGTFLAPFRSGIKIEDYQLDPLVRALQVPRANLLLADGVGLGKTIEAGLVIQEFVHRNRIQRILILCPSSLQLQWQEEMRDKFGLDFRIVDHQAMRDLRRKQGIHANPWSSYPRLITSYDFLKQDHVLRVFKDLIPEGTPSFPRRFGMLVVDECHNVAPGGRGMRNSQRTTLVKEIGPHFEHKLFLSATPHNGYSESFTALLELLDNQRYMRGAPLNKEQLHGVTMVRRLKSDEGLAERFCKRDIEPIYIGYSEEERTAHALLQQYAKSRRAVASGSDYIAVEFVLKALKKRFFSSPAAFRSTLETHLKTLTEPRDQEKKKSAPGILARMLKEMEDAENNLAEESIDHDELVDSTVKMASQEVPKATPEQIGMLNELLSWARRAEMLPDTRLRVLMEWLDKHIKPGGQWTNERVIIFTEARASQKYLWNQLSQRGYAEDGRAAMMYGGMPPEERQDLKNAFLADPKYSKVRILLATDTASEGVNLHHHCCKLVHWDTSWRPTVMEQRNGRVDRHGQPRDVTIFHFAPVSAATENGRSKDDLDDDLEFLFVAAKKTSQIREDLGRVGPVIAEQIEERMLGKRSVLDTTLAENETNKIRRLLKAEVDLAEQVKRLNEEYEVAKREMHLTPENVRKVVEVGLKLANQLPLEPVEVPEVGTAFKVPVLTGAWSECLKGLEHPFTKEPRPIVFDPKQAEGRDTVVLAHLNHRLVAMCLGLLRAAVWERDQGKIKRITVKTVSKYLLDTPAVIVHGRLLVLGKTMKRLHEELLVAGGKTVDNKWVRFTETELKEIVSNQENGRGSDRIIANVRAKWPQLEPILRRTLEARMKERTATLDSRIEKKRDTEKGEVEKVLLELKAQLQQGLEKPDQLELDFGEFDRADYSNLLRHRIAQIPEEIKREQAALDERYAEPTPRLFPVAITIVLPKEAN